MPLESKGALRLHTANAETVSIEQPILRRLAATLGLIQREKETQAAKDGREVEPEKRKAVSTPAGKEEKRQKRQTVSASLTDFVTIARLGELVGAENVEKVIVDPELAARFEEITQLAELGANEETRQVLLKISNQLLELAIDDRYRQIVNTLRGRIADKLVEYQARPEEIVQAMHDLPGQTREEAREVIQQVRLAQAGQGDYLPGVEELVAQASNLRGLSESQLKALDSRLKAKIPDVRLPYEPIPWSPSYITEKERVGASLEAIEDALEKVALQIAEVVAEEIRGGQRRPLGEFESLKEFVDELSRQEPGRLAGYLHVYPELRGRLLDIVARIDSPPEEKARKEENRRQLHRLFLHIMRPILQERRTPSSESLDLYRRADLVTFINLTRAITRTQQERRLQVGDVLADYYILLKKSLIQSHDIDYWASSTAVKPEDFARSQAFFQNEDVGPLLSNPLVSTAYRAYEEAIMIIRESNGGYILPCMVNGPIGEKPWDDLAQHIFEKMLSQGVVYQAELDQYGLPKFKDGKVVFKPLTREQWLANQLDPLEIYEALKLGKGFGIATIQLIRHFAYSRGPGSYHSEYGMPGFHSLADYELTAMYLNPTAHLFAKWMFGGWKHWHFFNQMLPEPFGKEELERRVRLAGFDPDNPDPKKLYRLAREPGGLEKVFGKGAKLIIDIINLTSTSNLGPFSGLWRFLDASVNWNVKDREKLGGTINLMLANVWASGYVKEVLATNNGRMLIDNDGDLALDGFRLQFAQDLQREGKIRISPKNDYWIPETVEDRKTFEKLWSRRGTSPFPGHGKYKGKIEARWDEIKNKKQTEELISAVKQAYLAKTWVQMAERNPLFVARLVKVKSHRREGGPEYIPLRELLIEEILEDEGKPLELDIDLVNLGTPKDIQIKRLKAIADLEGDVATIREYLIRRQEGYSEYGATGFAELVSRHIKGPNHQERQRRVIKYWELTRKALLGNWEADRWIREIGLGWRNDAQGNLTELYHDVNKIKKIGSLDTVDQQAGARVVFDKLSNTYGREISIEGPLLPNFYDMQLSWSVDFTDALWDELDWLNLGPRQFARGGGDYASHAAGIKLMSEYVPDILTHHFDDDHIKIYVEHLKKIRMAIQGDDISFGWQGAYLWALATMRLFKQPAIFAKTGIFGDVAGLFMPTSYAQKMAVSHTEADAADANQLLKFIHTLHAADVLPPRPEVLALDQSFFRYMEHHNIKKLEHKLGATWSAVVLEALMTIATAAPLFVMLMAAWQSVTQKEEEK